MIVRNVDRVICAFACLEKNGLCEECLLTITTLKQMTRPKARLSHTCFAWTSMHQRSQCNCSCCPRVQVDAFCESLEQNALQTSNCD